MNKEVSVSELDLCCRAHLEPLCKPIDLLVNYDDDTDWSAGLLGAPTVCVYLGEARQLREAYWWGCPVQSRPAQRLPNLEVSRAAGHRAHPPGWRSEDGDRTRTPGRPQGKWKKLLSSQIIHRQFTVFVYFFNDGASFLYLCNRRVPNSVEMQL